MKKSQINLTVQLVVSAVAFLSGGAALADSVTVTSTTSKCCRPAVVIDSYGQPAVIESVLSVVPIGMVTTQSTVTAIKLYRPDDLITRRDDLLTRVAIERSTGTLSDSQASDLIGRIEKLDADRSRLVRDDSVAYFKQVKQLYAGFDRVANSMRKEGGEGDRQLASNYIVF